MYVCMYQCPYHSSFMCARVTLLQLEGHWRQYRADRQPDYFIPYVCMCTYVRAHVCKCVHICMYVHNLSHVVMGFFRWKHEKSDVPDVYIDPKQYALSAHVFRVCLSEY